MPFSEEEKGGGGGGEWPPESPPPPPPLFCFAVALEFFLAGKEEEEEGAFAGIPFFFPSCAQGRREGGRKVPKTGGINLPPSLSSMPAIHRLPARSKRGRLRWAEARGEEGGIYRRVLKNENFSPKLFSTGKGGGRRRRGPARGFCVPSRATLGAASSSSEAFLAHQSTSVPVSPPSLPSFLRLPASAAAAHLAWHSLKGNTRRKERGRGDPIHHGLGIEAKRGGE